MSPTRPIIVQKFGGTSVGTVTRIQRVAQLALAAQQTGYDVVVVVSAMSGETNRLLALATDVAVVSSRRERDTLVSSGEQVTAALTAIAIEAAGGKARSFLGHQIRMITDSNFSDARVRQVETQSLLASLARGEIPVIAGFQGIDLDGNITTLGRGGSDTTAVAVAAALQAAVCDIYTDVEGVYTADPNICQNARKLARVPYQQMLTLASLGAKVLHDRCVELALEHGVAVQVRSSFADVPGTWITAGDGDGRAATIGGIACDRNLSHVLLQAHSKRSDINAMIATLAAKSIHPNDIFDSEHTPSFTIKAADAAEARAILHEGSFPLAAIEDIAKVSVVGSRLTAKTAEKAQQILIDKKIVLQAILASETRVSILVSRDRSHESMRLLHDGLDVGTSPEHTTVPKQLRYGRGLGE